MNPAVIVKMSWRSGRESLYFEKRGEGYFPIGVYESDGEFRMLRTHFRNCEIVGSLESDLEKRFPQ